MIIKIMEINLKVNKMANNKLINRNLKKLRLKYLNLLKN